MTVELVKKLFYARCAMFRASEGHVLIAEQPKKRDRHVCARGSLRKDSSPHRAATRRSGLVRTSVKLVYCLSYRTMSSA